MYKIVDGKKVKLDKEESAMLKRKQTLRLIAMLEEKITQRRIREAIMTNDYSFITDIEKQIKKLRAKLPNR